MLAGVLLALGAAFSLTPFATPALALGLGIAVALGVGNPWRRVTSRISGRLLQGAVVGLGFGIPLDALVRAGTTGVAVTALTIAAVFAAGVVLARWLGVDRQVALLVTTGTGICGGSAIAAVGPAIGAGADAMGVSLATVFVLNAVALYAFPPIAHLVGLSQHQFGVWAALAIHDTSSVVGAAASYGAEALRDATVLKLARALWILPLTVALPAALHRRRRAAGTAIWSADGATDPAVAAAADVAGTAPGTGPVRPTRVAPIPWFIGLFVLAAVARSLLPQADLPWFDGISRAARVALVLTLYLIGANLTRAQLRAVGVRPFAHGLALWLAVAGATLAGVTLLVRG
ncbi:MAG: putative sulfate exporter family transporter [Gemmatimonadota bacterium]|nr:putative sulfate exporter family transporter [Gemmatimonadota bacterium]